MKAKVIIPIPDKIPEFREGVPIPTKKQREIKSQWDAFNIKKMTIGQSLVLEMEVTEDIKKSLSSYLGHLRSRSQLPHDYAWRVLDNGIGIWCIEYVKRKKRTPKAG